MDPTISSSPVGIFFSLLLHRSSGLGVPDSALHSRLAGEPAFTIRTSSGMVEITGATMGIDVNMVVITTMHHTSDSDGVGQLGGGVG